jgi:hypothetical protein
METSARPIVTELHFMRSRPPSTSQSLLSHDRNRALDPVAPTPDPRAESYTDIPLATAPVRHAGWRALLILACVVYLALLAWRIGACAGGSDSSGYLNQAKLLRAGTIHTATRALPELPAHMLGAYAYIPLGFSPASAGDPDRMVANYPIGLPLLIATASLACGWNLAPPLVMLAHALAGLALMYLLARDFKLSDRAAMAAVGLLALCPLYIFASLQVLSDLPALVWTMAAVWCARRSRDRLAWAWAAGAALSLAVLIRPTNALAIVPVALALGGNLRRWCALLAAGMPGAALFLTYNAVAYGHPLHTGYGPIWDAFALRQLAPNLAHYATWLPVLLTPLAALALLRPWLSSVPQRDRWLLAGWLGAFLGFYLFYPYTRQAWWGLRFLLPAFPALIVAAVFVAHQAIASLALAGGKMRWAGALAALSVLWLVPWNLKLATLHAGRNERVYVDACDWARVHLPSNAIVFATQTTGAIYYYTDFTAVHWQFVTPAEVARIEQAARASGRAVYAMLFPEEEQRLLREVFPGDWKPVGAVKHIRFWQRMSAASLKN